MNHDYEKWCKAAKLVFFLHIIGFIFKIFDTKTPQWKSVYRCSPIAFKLMWNRLLSEPIEKTFWHSLTFQHAPPLGMPISQTMQVDTPVSINAPNQRQDESNCETHHCFWKCRPPWRNIYSHFCVKTRDVRIMVKWRRVYGRVSRWRIRCCLWCSMIRRSLPLKRMMTPTPASPFWEPKAWSSPKHHCECARMTNVWGVKSCTCAGILCVETADSGKFEGLNFTQGLRINWKHRQVIILVDLFIVKVSEIEIDFFGWKK